jgi:hypothetical protein
MHLMFDTWTQERYGPLTERADSPTATARGEVSMNDFARGLFVTSAGLWAGAGVFFSLVTLPTLFMNMESADAGRIAALLFPGYYAFSLGAGALLLAAVAILARGGGRPWCGVALAVMLGLACHAYATASVRPRMGELRGLPTGVEEFQRLHRASVRLNTVVLVISFALLGGSAKLLDRR